MVSRYAGGAHAFKQLPGSPTAWSSRASAVFFLDRDLELHKGLVSQCRHRTRAATACPLPSLRPSPCFRSLQQVRTMSKASPFC